MSEDSLQSESSEKRSHLGHIAKHFVIYGFGGIAEKLVGFLLLPVYTSYLDPAEYGVLCLVLLTGVIVQLSISGGMHFALLKFYDAAPDARQKMEVYATIQAFLWVAAPLVVILMVPWAGTLSHYILGDRSCVRLFYLGLIYIPFGLTTDIAFSCFRAMHRSVSFVVFSLARFAASLTLNIVFVVGLGYGASGVLWSAILVSVVTAVAVQFVLLKGFGFHPDLRRLAPIMRYGLPLVPFTIFEFVMQDGNKFIIQWFCSPADVGVFSIAYKLGLPIFFFLSLPFERIWTVYVFDLAKKPEGHQVWGKVLTYLMLAATAASLMISLFIPEIVQVMARNPAYWGAARLVPVILLAHLFYASTRVFNGGLLVTGKGEILSAFTAIGFAVSLLANLLLIYFFGLMGAAVATLVTQIVMASMSYWVNQRAFPIAYEWKRIGVPLLLACALFALGQLQGTEHLWRALGVHALLFAAFPVCLLLLGFFTRGEKAVAWEWIGRARELAMRPWRRSPA